MFFMEKKGYVYMMSNQKCGTIYIGVTSDLYQRVWQHKQGTYDGFTKKYQLKKLVYFEECNCTIDAITREKQLKGGSREKKICLIEKVNPERKDLSLTWYS